VLLIGLKVFGGATSALEKLRYLGVFRVIFPGSLRRVLPR